jgi:hypothetical protein
MLTTSDSRRSHPLVSLQGPHSACISRILRARAYLDILARALQTFPTGLYAGAFVSGTGRGALVIFFASHEFNFKVQSERYTMASHRVMGLTVKLPCSWNTSPCAYACCVNMHVRSCLRIHVCSCECMPVCCRARVFVCVILRT